MRTIVAALLFLAGCAHHRALPPSEGSGFLDDYALLRPGAPGDLAMVYRDPKVDWHAYHTVMLDPVTLWRSGEKSLDVVPREDLLRLVSDFQAAMQTCLGQDYRMTDAPGPDVLRIRLAITEAHAADPMLDVLTAPHGTGRPHPAGAGPLDAETKRFLQRAEIEGEVRDAVTNALLVEGVDRRLQQSPPLETWADVAAAFQFWADRACARLESRTGPR